MEKLDRKQRLLIFAAAIFLVAVIVVVVVIVSCNNNGPHTYDAPTATPTASPVATVTPMPTSPATPTPTPAPTPEPSKLVVQLQDTTSKVNMRYSASTDSDNVICQVASGTEVKPMDIAGKWMKVSYQGEIGYIMTSYLKLTGTLDGYIKLSDASSTVNLRSSASSTSQAVTTLKDGTELTIISISSDWIQVTAGEYSGYVSSTFVRLTQ